MKETEMATTEQTTVLLADDHPIMRDGLKSVLESAGGLKVIGTARDGVEAVELAHQLKPDVIVMDVMMPNKNGVDACREVMEALPDTRVLMLTASTEEDAVVEAIAAGATGYLQKHSGPEELTDTLRAVAQGRLSLPDQSVRRVFAMLRGEHTRSGDPGRSALTPVELEIVAMFARGMSYAKIGEARGTKTVSVRNAVYRIQDKLGLDSKQALVVWAVRHNLLDETTPD